tara:strand:+ start:2352 stop:2759 length:408 start_codon:yes stop_codon:yes gene_type:complete
MHSEEEILGLDYGEKRIGVSISRLNKKMAIPHSIIQYRDIEVAFDKIKKITENNNIKLIVLGIPKTLKNEIGFKAKEVLSFKEKLSKNIKIDVELEDERLSTVQALNSIDRKSKNKYVDDSSATIILNNYLEKLR